MKPHNQHAPGLDTGLDRIIRRAHAQRRRDAIAEGRRLRSFGSWLAMRQEGDLSA